MSEPGLGAITRDAGVETARLEPEALLELMARLDSSSRFVQEAGRLLDRVLPTGEIPLQRPPLPEPKLLTIAMVADDFDGVYFSIQAIRLYQPEVRDEVHFLVLDPRPAVHGESLRGLGAWLESYTYWPCTEAAGIALHDFPFRHGRSEFVLMLEPGALLAPGSLAALVAFLRHHSPGVELMQGPLVSANGRVLATHWEAGWEAGRCGRPVVDAAAERGQPFEIAMQDLGAFVCRRDAWPGINPRLGGAAGLEGYLHEKFRRTGGRTLCLPFLRWQRRNPAAARGGPCDDAAARFRDHLVMHDELGLDPQPLYEQLEPMLAERRAAGLRGELDSAFALFDAVFCVHPAADSPGRWRACERFARIGLERVRWIDAVATPADERIGRALARRAIIEHAAWRRLESVLILDADVELDPSATSLLQNARKALWSALWTDAGGTLRCAGPADEGLLIDPEFFDGPAALGVHRGLYQRLLDEIPSTPSGVARWLRHRAAVRELSVDSPALAACST
jgi:hypothetical protein